MSDEKEFQARLQQIGRLINGLNTTPDAKIRVASQELVQLVMELHALGLEKMMEIIFAQGDCGAEIIQKLGRNRSVGSLLALHGLHPDDLETRVARAVEQVNAQLRKQEVEVRLITVEESSVRVHVQINAHACGSTYAGVRSAIEEAVYEAAPEIDSLVVEGLEGKSGNGFVALAQLAEASAPAPRAGEN